MQHLPTMGPERERHSSDYAIASGQQWFNHRVTTEILEPTRHAIIDKGGRLETRRIVGNIGLLIDPARAW